MEMSMRGTRFTFYPWKSHVPINSGEGGGGNFSVLMEGVHIFLFVVTKTSDPSLNLSEKRSPCTLFTQPFKNEPFLSKPTYIMPLLKGSNK